MSVNYLYEKREMEEETRLGGSTIFIFSTTTSVSAEAASTSLVFWFDRNSGNQQNLFLISYFLF